MKIRPNNVKLVQIRNNDPIKFNRWKHTKDEQLSIEQLSNGYTKASGMEENNDSSLGLASLELYEVVTSLSSSPSWREFDHKFLSPISKGERSLTLKELLT